MNVGIIDIVSFSNDNSIYSRYTNPLFYSIMPQVIGSYAKRLGHKVWYYPYMGHEDLYEDLNYDIDILFISSYTMSAYLAYSIANIYKSKGITTVIGGPHSRSYPEDCASYFDYIIGLCDYNLIKDLLNIHDRNDPKGIYLTSNNHPNRLPSLKERWEFIKIIHKKSPIFCPPTVTMMTSTGCTNKCSFCIDSVYDFKLFPKEDLKNDLLFLKEKKKTYNIIWDDPNFGINLDDNLNIIEEVNANNLVFGGELNLKKLTEDNCKRLQKNKFWGVAPGLESWRSYSHKSLKGRAIVTPIDKLNYLVDQLNMVKKYLPIIQVNIIFGLDEDTNIYEEEAFELTHQFIKRTPGVYTNFQTLTIFGKSTPLYNSLIGQKRLINLPFNMMDGFSMSNVTLKCSPYKFYKLYSKLLKSQKSLRLLFRTLYHCKMKHGKLLYLLKNLTGRLDYKHFEKLAYNIHNTSGYYEYFSGESNKVPYEFLEKIKEDLGTFYNFLPKTIFKRRIL